MKSGQAREGKWRGGLRPVLPTLLYIKQELFFIIQTFRDMIMVSHDEEDKILPPLVPARASVYRGSSAFHHGCSSAGISSHGCSLTGDRSIEGAHDQLKGPYSAHIPASSSAPSRAVRFPHGEKPSVKLNDSRVLKFHHYSRGYRRRTLKRGGGLDEPCVCLSQPHLVPPALYHPPNLTLVLPFIPV